MKLASVQISDVYDVLFALLRCRTRGPPCRCTRPTGGSGRRPWPSGSAGDRAAAPGDRPSRLWCIHVSVVGWVVSCVSDVTVSGSRGTSCRRSYRSSGRLTPDAGVWERAGHCQWRAWRLGEMDHAVRVFGAGRANLTLLWLCSWGMPAENGPRCRHGRSHWCATLASGLLISTAGYKWAMWMVSICEDLLAASLTCLEGFRMRLAFVCPVWMKWVAQDMTPGASVMFAIGPVNSYLREYVSANHGRRDVMRYFHCSFSYWFPTRSRMHWNGSHGDDLQ